MLEKLSTNDNGVKPWVFCAAIVLGVLVWGYLVHAFWTSTDESREVTMMCMTEGCSYQRARPLQFKERLPAKCPDCGEQSVVPAFHCRGCGEPLILYQYRGLKPPTKCPNCGEERYGR